MMCLPKIIQQALSHRSGAASMDTSSPSGTGWWYIHPDKAEEVLAYVYLFGYTRHIYNESGDTCWDTSRIQLEVVGLSEDIRGQYS